LKQIALLVFMPRKETRPLGGGQAIHVSVFLKRITDHFSAFPMTRAQVPEQFPILRALQFVVQYRK